MKIKNYNFSLMHPIHETDHQQIIPYIQDFANSNNKCLDHAFFHF